LRPERGKEEVVAQEVVVLVMGVGER